MKFQLIEDENQNPKCPDCMGGRLFYYKSIKEWVCCSLGGSWMWCGRRYKGVKDKV